MRRNYLIFITFMAFVAVVFGTFWFATAPDAPPLPPPCSLVAVGSQSITRSNGTTIVSIAPIKKTCEENQP